MKIYKNFNVSKKFKSSAIAIGNFDGFHLGHQKVIKSGKYLARKHKLKFGGTYAYNPGARKKTFYIT